LIKFSVFNQTINNIIFILSSKSTCGLSLTNKAEKILSESFRETNKIKLDTQPKTKVFVIFLVFSVVSGLKTYTYLLTDPNGAVVMTTDC
jgi:hypothetical protein